jgi:hypothetical protein
MELPDKELRKKLGGCKEIQAFYNLFMACLESFLISQPWDDLNGIYCHETLGIFDFKSSRYLLWLNSVNC